MELRQAGREDSVVPGAARGDVRFVYLAACVAAVGGLLFGYDTAVIAGAIGFLQKKFALTAALKGWAASSALIGCIIGGMFAGSSSDRLGRRKVLLVTALLFGVSAVWSSIPRDLTQFALARMIGGVGVGAASMLSPLYIAEIAPARIRGRLVSINQLAIVSGMLLVYFVNAWVAGRGGEEWNVEVGWRWMFASETLPAVVFLVLLLFVPESPRWLTKQGREGDALRILCRVSGREEAGRSMAEIKGAIAIESGTGLAQLFRPGLRTALLIGVVMAVLQQVTGINAVLYYAPEIFKRTGTGIGTAMMQTVLVGAVNVAFTLVAIWLVDRSGRKALLLIGSASMALSLLVIGGAFRSGAAGNIWIVVFILFYIAAFAVAMGPVTWVVLSEIFPTRIRGRAMSFATVVLWCSCFAVSQTFPILLEKVGSAWTFWIYMILSVSAFFFVLAFLPETRGRTLEEIETGWRR